MRRFSYVWKSGDGERHVDEIRARSKDDAFAELRRRGIRPVKVEVLPRPWWWRAAWCAAAAAAVLLVAVLVRWRTAEGRERLEGFRAVCETIVEQHLEQMAKLGLSAASAGEGDFERRLERGFRVIEVSRSRLRLAYRDFDGGLHGDVERLYGHYTAVLDADLERLDDLAADSESEMQ